jgi:hypothetical protein
MVINHFMIFQDLCKLRESFLFRQPFPNFVFAPVFDALDVTVLNNVGADLCACACVCVCVCVCTGVGESGGLCVCVCVCVYLFTFNSTRPLVPRRFRPISSLTAM